MTAVARAGRREDRTRTAVAWALRERAAHRAANGGRDPTYEELHRRLTERWAARDPALSPLPAVPSFTTFYRRVRDAVARGDEYPDRTGTNNGGAHPCLTVADRWAGTADSAPHLGPTHEGDGVVRVRPYAPGPLDGGALLLDELDDVADAHTAREEQGGQAITPAIRPPVPASAPTSRMLVPSTSAAAGRTLEHSDVTDDAGVFRTKSIARFADGLERAWGALASEAPRPAIGAVVARTTQDKTFEDGAIRVRLLTTVLNGALDYEQCADLWRRVFTKRATTLECALLPQIPPEAQQRYRRLSGRTLRRWHTEVLGEEAEAAHRGEPARPNAVVLAHTYKGDHALPRTWTPEVEARVTALWREHNGDWSAAHIARHLTEEEGLPVSERTAQDIVRTKVSDRDRAAALGGADALDVLFRLRVLREATAPMDCWIMDHSFIKHEVQHPEHPEYTDQVRDFAWECDAALDRRFAAGHVERRRTKGLHLTIIQDAFTRRVLAIRLWDRVPTTEMTLTVLYDAILRYGVPRVLYTDNGGDFRSHALALRLEAVGIRHVFSLPYSPEGRARQERMFGAIKQVVMPGIRGYRGGKRPREWRDEDLDTLEEVEAAIWRGIEQLHNYAGNRRRRRSPVQVWNDHPTARSLVNPATDPHLQAALLGLLQVKKDCVRQVFGIELHGRTYLGMGLLQVMQGSTVWAYYATERDAVVHLAAPTPTGEVRSLGPAEFYDDEHPVGDAAALFRLEAEWIRSRDADRDRRQLAADVQQAVAGRRAAGEAVATALVESIGDAVAALAAEDGLPARPRAAVLPAVTPLADAAPDVAGSPASAGPTGPRLPAPAPATPAVAGPRTPRAADRPQPRRRPQPAGIAVRLWDD